jgi:hypothetical protein
MSSGEGSKICKRCGHDNCDVRVNGCGCPFHTVSQIKAFTSQGLNQYSMHVHGESMPWNTGNNDTGISLSR